MYIETGSKTYPCKAAPALEGDTLRFVLPEGGPELGEGPTGVLRLCMDDGFEMLAVDVSGYLRWEMVGETLTITNVPVPKPTPTPEPVEPVEPGPSTEDALVQAVVELQYQVDQMRLGR